MKKILVIFTGGTIGSTISNGSINVDESSNYRLIEKFYQNSQVPVEFETLQSLNILSENCIPADWSKLLQALKNKNLENKNLKNYDGVVITHGTDTLAYTAAVIGYVFGGIHIPVVLTASNYALDHPKSNGARNFASSVEFICTSNIPGVFAVFEDEKGRNKIYLATRLTEADPFNDQFSSFGGIDLGYLEKGVLIENKSVYNPAMDALMMQKSLPVIHHAVFDNIEFDHDILAIRPYPGLNYKFFDFEKNRPRAIVHKLYHSATACVRDGNVSLPEFIAYCAKKDIDFYLTSFKNFDDDFYVTTRKLLGSDIIPLQNISFEAAVAKLWLAYNSDIKNPEEFMKNNIYYEYLVMP